MHLRLKMPKWVMLSGLILTTLVSSPVFAEEEQGTIAEAIRPGFKLQFMPADKQVYKDIKTIFEHSNQFQTIVKQLNAMFDMPVSVKVRFEDADGPVYQPDKRRVVMNYDFIFYLATLYLTRYPDAKDDEMIDFALRASTFLFYHEVAHALIDVFNLPIVSNEETAADNLAVILAFEFNKDGFSIVIDSAELFDLLDQAKKSDKYDDSDYWDEHSLDAQRFYNILCMAYGVYPEKVKKLIAHVKNKKMHQFVDEREQACSYLYDQQLSAWSTLLKPYFRK